MTYEAPTPMPTEPAETPVITNDVKVFKKKVNREVLILGGIVLGIVIAGGFSLLKRNPCPEILVEPDVIQLTGDITLSVAG